MDWFVHVKRALLPFYNGSAHRVRTLGDHAAALLCGRIERCTCCGRLAPMLLRNRVIPPKLREVWGLSPRVADAVARKESLDCGSCGSKMRTRRLARTIMATYPARSNPQYLRDWARSPEMRSLRIAEINRIDGVHEAIAAMPGLSSSDYAEPDQLASQSHLPSEDLSRLSYESNTFDLVLTSETLEHVPDLSAALGEIHRVLKQGGHHLCTIPRLPGVARTFSRRRIDPSGRIMDLASPISHPGGDWGYPVFTEFGDDFAEIVERAGFVVEEKFGPVSEDDVAQVYLCRKV